MIKEIEDRVRQLRLTGLSARQITPIILKEYPDNTITFNGMRNRIDVYLRKIGMNNLKTLNIPKVTAVINSPAPTDDTITDNMKKLKNSVEYKSDGSRVYEGIIELFENEEVTPERILQAHHLDPIKWDVVSYKNNYWSQQTKQGKTVILYQSKIIVKPKKDEVDLYTVLTYFEDKLANHTLYESQNTSNHNIKTFQDSNPKMLEINICDLHLGKLAYNEESNDAYDCQRAYDNFFKVIHAEYETARKYKVEKILFVWSNDFFNSDGISNSTTNGTPQTTALPWQQLFLKGCDMLTSAIELLSQIAPVKTFYIASNHSRQSDFYALCYLSAWFKNNSKVTIDISQKSRHYESYGVNLIGFAHSYYEKESTLYHLMSNECPAEWSKCTYKEFHLAHYHSEKVKEVGGVIYRWLPSTTGTDVWHYDKGYVGAIKRSYSFLYDKNKGLIQINCTII